jgi:hypothetical protein
VGHIPESFFKVNHQSLCCLNDDQVIHLGVTRSHLTTQPCCSKVESKSNSFLSLSTSLDKQREYMSALVFSFYRTETDSHSSVTVTMN